MLPLLNEIVITDRCLHDQSLYCNFSRFPGPYVHYLSLSDNCSGDSIVTFIRWDKLMSDSLFRKRDLISFIWEKLLSTDAVVTGIVRQTVANDFRLGYIAPIMSLVTIS